MKSFRVLGAIARFVAAIDVLPHQSADGRRYSWYLSGTC